MKRMKKAACGEAAQNVDRQICCRHLRLGSNVLHRKSRCTHCRRASRKQNDHPELEVQS
jgi:hypothetical protein